ncbi:hypothetical protein HDV06_001375 [Boothiomyces sp. JEL0866]|nr:hypothetical protein HDV06_001375 [Boothiomyces sp. JEL0866]
MWKFLFFTLLRADIYRDIYAEQHRISISSTPIQDPDLTLPFKGALVKCKTPSIIPEPETQIDKTQALELAIQAIEEITECLEYNNGDFVYSICPKKTVIQRFSTDLRDSEGLTDLEWKLIQKIRYKLGAFSVVPPTNVPYFNLGKPAGSYLSIGIDGTFRLKQLWGSGDFCEEISQKRQIIYSCGPEMKIMSVNEYSVCLYTMHIKSPLLCDIDGFGPREYKESGKIECFVDRAVFDNLEAAELKRWRLEQVPEEDNFVLFS